MATTDKYSLLWVPSLDRNAALVDITTNSAFVGTRHKNSEGKLVEEVTQDPMDIILSKANIRKFIIPLNSKISTAQEYSPQMPNKLTQYATLGGNSVTVFGEGIKKIGLRVSVIKAGNFWIPYQAGLEAFGKISANPSRYYGSLYLMGFDSTQRALPRKYKVVIESLSFSHRSDRNNIMDADISILVVHDFNTPVGRKSGQWGRL